MQMPRFYLACAALFWAWHAQVIALGVVMALALEAPRFTGMRWRFASADFARIADLCTWALAILAGYLTFTRPAPVPVLEIFLWLPLVVLPLVLAQLYSESGRMPLSALFLMLRGGKHAPPQEGSVDLSPAYVVTCAVTAGAANVRHEAYYLGLFLLAAWALWSVRSPRYRWYAWAPLVACVGVLGYAGHVGLNRLQAIVVESALEWIVGDGSLTDPYRSTSAIGHIGDLKQSDRIVLHVTVPAGAKPPFLLHRASYDAYLSPAWFSREAPFTRVDAASDQRTWTLSDARGAVARMTVSERIERDKAVLSLPIGTARIERLPAAGMKRNVLGTVEIEQSGDLALYDAVFDPQAASRDSPRQGDLRVPAKEEATLARIADELQLKGKPAREVLAIVHDYFKRDFNYSTYQARRAVLTTPLADFLLNTRAGHCEYFATASALLLRAAGVPARYATGYSVQEWSPLENGYVARLRHAHAWVRAYVDGAWIDFDTTPPAWFAAEAEGASFLRPISDLWAWAAFRYARWQNEEPDARAITAAALIVPLVAILIWRLLLRQPMTAARAGAGAAASASRRSRPGVDSEFYQIEALLAGRGHARYSHEPLRAWLTRLAREHIAVEPLAELLRLHYRYRFDPEGLSANERAALRARVQDWLQANAGRG